jgi:hypothetical protein
MGVVETAGPAAGLNRRGLIGGRLVNIARRITNKVVRRSSRLFETCGYHVVPANYNSPIPHSSELPGSLFYATSDCVGIDWNMSVQERYLTEVFPEYFKEVEFFESPWLFPIDATVLHAMVRHNKPKKMVEIGSGYSTGIAAAAITQNGIGEPGQEFVAIDPVPRSTLFDETPGLTKIIQKPVQEVDLAEIIDCDLLFIDSSHIGMHDTFAQHRPVVSLEVGDFGIEGAPPCKELIEFMNSK